MGMLFYEYVADIAEKRPLHRSEHLGLAREWHKDGQMVIAGAYGDPLDGGVLVFRDKATAEAFASIDPYVRNGLVTRWWVRDWDVVIGG
jgi:uncharacterized protein YciI